jgi:16S rRNA U1498 N3-methylase RsmE
MLVNQSDSVFKLPLVLAIFSAAAKQSNANHNPSVSRAHANCDSCLRINQFRKNTDSDAATKDDRGAKSRSRCNGCRRDQNLKL